jgi:hypothetical protein
MPARVLPKILTVADWNSKKGTIAKMAGETGIGAALAKLKVEWDKIDWSQLDPDEAVNKHAKNGKMTVAALDLLEPVAKANIGKINAVRTQLKAVETLTGQIETKWRASKVIPSSSRVQVGNMKTEADHFSIALKSIDNDWKYARERVTKEEARLKAQALSVIKPYFASIRKNGAEVKANATVAKYTGDAGKGFHQNIRGLNAALDRSQEPTWIAWKDTNWKPLAQDSYKPTQDSQVVAKVDHVLDVLDQLERLVG